MLPRLVPCTLTIAARVSIGSVLDANESFLLPTEADRMKMARAAADVALNRYPDPLASRPLRRFRLPLQG